MEGHCIFCEQMIEPGKIAWTYEANVGSYHTRCREDAMAAPEAGYSKNEDGFTVLAVEHRGTRRARDWRMAWIQTKSGKKFMPFGPPEPQDIDIEDIAHALSMVCRWGGACKTFYSVAEHSVHVSTEIKEELALAGLLHDAAEAYLGDIPGPLKATPVFEAYRREEDALLEEIFARFKVPGLSPDGWKELHEVDVRIGATEARDLMPGLMDYYAARDIQPYPVDFLSFEDDPPWSPVVAKETFLERFKELKKG